MQVYFVTTSKGMDQPICNLDLKNSPLNMLFRTCIGVITWHSKHIQTPQNLCLHTRLSWAQNLEC